MKFQEIEEKVIQLLQHRNVRFKYDNFASPKKTKREAWEEEEERNQTTETTVPNVNAVFLFDTTAR